jgi:3-mercaptopyruvate sulfurtransferase SseA
VVLELQKLGFTNAYALLGGLAAYQAANLPTETAPEPTPATTQPAQPGTHTTP